MYYFTKQVAPTAVPFSGGTCYIKAKEVHGPFVTEASMIKAMTEHVEEERGNSASFEVVMHYSNKVWLPPQQVE